MAKKNTKIQEDLLASTPENSDSESERDVQLLAKSKKSKSDTKTVERKESKDLSSKKKESKHEEKSSKVKEVEQKKSSKVESKPVETKTHSKTEVQKVDKVKLEKREVVQAPKKVAAPVVVDTDSLSSDSESESEEEVVVKKVSSKKQEVAKESKKERKSSMASKKSRKSSAADNDSSSESEVEVKKAVVPLKKVKVPETKVVATPKTNALNPKLAKMKKAIEESEDEDSDDKKSESESESESEKESKKSSSSESDSESDKKSSSSESEEKKPVKKEVQPVKQQLNANSNVNAQTEVIVSNLPFNATENDIKKHFKICKSILSVKIMMGADGRPRGKAFVKFETEEDMKKAITLNESQINGRQIWVEQTRPRENNGFAAGQDRNARPAEGNGQITESQNIIVRNLPFTVDEDNLKSEFAHCGDIKGVRIMKNEEGRSKGFGFVDFSSVDSARNAIKKSGSSIQGRQVNIEFSLPRGPGGYQGGSKPGVGFGGNRGGSRDNRGGFVNERRGYTSGFSGEQVDL